MLSQPISFRLEKNFGYEDDYVIESLEKAMEELKKSKLDHPGAPPDNELPQQPFGMEVWPLCILSLSLLCMSLCMILY